VSVAARLPLPGALPVSPQDAVRCPDPESKTGGTIRGFVAAVVEIDGAWFAVVPLAGMVPVEVCKRLEGI
jgi:hypothetical protein